MKYLSYTIVFTLIILNLKAQQLDYPPTTKVNQIDTYFGVAVPDPYRWLEAMDSSATADWVTAQNEVTFAYLEQIPFREKIKDRLTEIWDYERVSAPFKEGTQYYFFKNDGLQNQSVLFQKESLDAQSIVFFDPNQLSEDGTKALRTFSFSNDGKYFAYGVSSGGSDWSEIFIMDVATQTLLEDHIEWAKFTGISWHKEGFFYSRYDAPEKELASKNEYHKVYYHKVGTPQSEDELIYEDTTQPLRNFYASTSDDDRFLYIYMSEGTSGNQIYFQDLSQEGSTLQPLVEGFDFESSIVDNIGSEIYMRTNHDAPRYKLVKIDANNPSVENWQTVIPEHEKDVLQGVSIVDNKLITNYLEDVKSKVVVLDLEGKFLHEVTFPTLGNVYGFGGKKEDKEVFYTFTSFIYPPTVFQYNIAQNESTLYKKPTLNFDINDYETKQVFYPSKDGTMIPMFLTYKKGLVQNGNNPTYLYGYGGFNVSLEPGFRLSAIPFLENGGIYAVANLRGGAEYGEEWHKAGMLLNKQNVFDDFISAGEYLIQENYTSSEKLAIAGGSNGGLLVGACLNQRPDLFQVALPAVGVMDMLRFHKFTIGWAWVVEYGSSERDEAEFQNLLAISPVHNIQAIDYPAVMVTTADHDDRVVPAHSFKYMATLQEKNTSNQPTLIRIETQAGHGAGKPTSKVIEELADIWSFVFYNMDESPYENE